MALIACEGLVKIYKTADLEVFALQGLDLQVEQGEMMAIIGNSGSGKSTLLNMLGALETPSAGRCSVAGYDLLKLSAAEKVRYHREVTAFVWQNNARNLLPYLTAQGNVELPLLLSGQAGAAARTRARELLEVVGLKDRAHHRLTALSGGEQQRVAIALALVNRPMILLADEPTGSVDTATADAILGVFRTVNRLYGTTVILVTHDRSLARAVDRYVQIRDGKVAQEAVRSAAGDGEELLVLDAAGRLPLPRELLEQVGLKDRARVEVQGEHIIIRRP